MEARLGFDFPLNRVPFLNDLNDAAAIAAHRSTVLESDEPSYPYLHTLITYRLEGRLIKGGKSNFCNVTPWQITLANSFSLMVTIEFEGLSSV